MGHLTDQHIQATIESALRALLSLGAGYITCQPTQQKTFRELLRRARDVHQAARAQEEG